MALVQSLDIRHRVEFDSAKEIRSYLIIDSLVRKKLNSKCEPAPCLSPLAVLDYVDCSKPCSSMSEELSQYQKFVSSQPDIQYGVT